MKIHSKYTVAFLVALLAGLTSTAYAEVTDAKHTELVNKADTADTPPNAVNNTNMGNDTRDGISLDSDATGVGDRLADADKGEDVVPEGLTDSAWKGIRQAYEQHRHAAVAVDGEFRARNPGQQWLTHFDGRGFVVKPDAAGWQWGLQLQSYGFPGHQRAVKGQAKVTAKDDRVTYDWHDGLHEWFVNDRSGLEHGFTISSRPPGARDSKLGTRDRLELRLTVRGGLRAQGHANGQGVSFVNQQGSTVINYAGLKVWDADHRQLPARIDADSIGLRLTVDERNARYPLTIDPIAQQAYLKASNTDAYDRFGNSVAVSGDTVVIGASYEDSNATGVDGNQADNSATQSGAAYVFVRDGVGVWSQQAYLKASNTDTGDFFGWSVSVSGDTVVVGGRQENSNATGVDGSQADNSAINSGAAYVFVRSGSVWSQQAYLKASNTDASDLFGGSVAVSGDTVVVGAFREASNATGVGGNQVDNSVFEAGAVYVFVRDSGGAWSQQAYLKASNTGSEDRFGAFVAVSSDTMVVGALFESSSARGVNGNQANNSFIRSGAAYVFVRDSSGVWSQQAYLKASNTGREDLFGSSVAVSGDTVVVGASSEGNIASFSGAAYVFVRDAGGEWSQQAYLKASNTDARDVFGRSVAVSGNTVVVGANGEDSYAMGVNGNQADNSSAWSGAAYVFVRDGGGIWSQQAYLKASNTDANDVFGRSVAVSGDTVVIGAIWEASNATGVNGNQGDNSAGNSGAAYVYIITPLCGDGVVEGDEQCDGGVGCTACCLDQDEDGVCDDVDNCPLDPNKVVSGQCGCGKSEVDTDGDTVSDCIDTCPGVDDNVFGDCSTAIPTVSEWGLIILSLLLLVGGKAYFGRSRTKSV